MKDINDEYIKSFLMPNGIVISHYTNEKYINKHNRRNSSRINN